METCATGPCGSVRVRAGPLEGLGPEHVSAGGKPNRRASSVQTRATGLKSGLKS